ncbi:hypothetical protein IWQ60_005405 [Tieghemiomyces parasiticus]|uniref:UBR-type domain-containing protein n=1 Tax=Tieghemiomyces parasiticus TaxID=78921 RepID=A0A9W8DUN1_9FUNG|nr:hypothetical protein IWQ60_005405 [Tieghemiomyces parasiticus]
MTDYPLNPATTAAIGVDDDSLTAADYLIQQARLEREAEEVLPGKFDECTFNLGYIHQPVYVCITCSRETRDGATDAAADDDNGAGISRDLVVDHAAGICYSCSIACHASHEVIELFNKRHFRCDCGSRQMPHTTCTLEKKDTIFNDENRYGHNFVGKYCRCDRPYNPDSEEQTMYQCAVCADWFHSACIGEMPDPNEFDDYVCTGCVEQYAPIFKRLPRSDHVRIGRVNPDTLKVDSLLSVATDKPTMAEALDSAVDLNVTPITADEESRPTKRIRSGDPISSTATSADGYKLVPLVTSPTTARATDGTPCQLLASPYQHPVALFGRDGWRDRLCHCPACYSYLRDHHLLFILDADEPYEPEEDDTASTGSVFDSGMRLLSTMDKAEAINGIMAYNKLRDELKSYLSPFAAAGKVVTEQDVRRFFETRTT